MYKEITEKISNSRNKNQQCFFHLDVRRTISFNVFIQINNIIFGRIYKFVFPIPWFRETELGAAHQVSLPGVSRGKTSDPYERSRIGPAFRRPLIVARCRRDIVGGQDLPAHAKARCTALERCALLTAKTGVTRVEIADRARMPGKFACSSHADKRMPD
ncbi:hypothetical protein [Aminobacter sp. MSH1]|uniref:hypothetical protein n=1 Tax=Aminobacter sp. MSH1 TaxID=374606 RepID=UPI000D394FB3|nr:hypothetical protein [Aminobacter sp. MSH1]